jgi:hypothetical protein
MTEIDGENIRLGTSNAPIASGPLLIALALILAFCFRLVFGLCSSFWTDDEKQIYLIGLKFYATRSWPYFGPDVTPTIQVPGALQGLSVGLPFFALPIPEAPYFLLNLLSFGSLVFFAWYCTRRLPQLPKWFVWTWLLTVPWTLGFSTQINNVSYILPGAILFFVAAIETYPFLTRGLIPLAQSSVMMGFGLFWTMQFHLSWVVLLPYLALSFYFQIRKQTFSGFLWFAAGAAAPLGFLVPTLVRYRLADGSGNTTEVIHFSPENLMRHANIVEGVLGRFLSFASYEVPRFIGNNTDARLAFVKENLWLTPIVGFLTLFGILQSIALFLLWFRRRHSEADWRAIKYFTLGTVILLYVCFIFSAKAPVSHTFYITFPVAMLYSLYCWQEFLQRKAWQVLAFVVLAGGLIFHAGLQRTTSGMCRFILLARRFRKRLAIGTIKSSASGDPAHVIN